MKFKFKNLAAIVLAVLICASVVISCPFALASPVEAKETASLKNRAEMTPEELIAEVAPPRPEEKEPLVKIQEAKEKNDDDIIGDVDGDNVISVLDATAIQRWLAELPTDLKESVADTDGDGHISITDATVIQRYIAEIPTPTDYPLTQGKEETFAHTHLFNNDVTLVKPTCEKGGERVGKCACGAIQTITYYPTGHEYEVDCYKEPTCDEPGAVNFKCKNCDDRTVDIFKDIAPLGHNFKEITIDPTCTEPGSVIRKCQNCDYSIIVRYINTSGHAIVHHNGKDATCTEDGYTEFDTCENCNYSTYEKIKAKGHTNSSPVKENEKDDGSYDEVVYCSVCKTELSRTHHAGQAHTHKPGTVVRENEKQPTCTETGSYDEVIYCKDCGEEISRTKKIVDKLPHSLNYVKEKPATEDNTGVKDHYECTACHKLFSDDEGKTEVSKDSLTIPKLAHTHKPASAVRENEVAATCSKTGSYEEVVYCSTCGEELSRTPKTIEKLAHTPDKAVRENEVAATCLKEGSYDEVIFCKVCDTEISRTNKKIAKADHSSTYVKEVSATTTKEGTKAHYECSVCKKLFSADNPNQEVTAVSLVIPKLSQFDPKTCSHHWVKYVIPYNYRDLYLNNRNAIPFTDDNTKNTLGTNNLGALFNQTGWAIYYCDKCHIADYDRFYTNQEFGRTQEEEEQYSLQLVNELRESLGLHKMYLDDYTTALAKERAKELLTDFSHDKCRVGTFENIATCSGGAKRAFDLWKESPGHYGTMTDSSKWLNFGYAYAVVPVSTNNHWRLVMVQVFKRMKF